MITAEQERALIERAQAGDRDAAGELLEAHARFWQRAARRYAGRDGEAYDDAMQEVWLAAFECIADFDLSRGLRFLTFVGRKIKWRLAILRWSDKLIRVPQPCNFDRLNAKFKSRAKLALNPNSLDAPVGSGDARLTLFADNSEVGEECERREAAGRVRLAIDQLDERTRHVILARMDGETLNDIGSRIGVGRERVRQIEAKALDRLRFLLTRRSPTARAPKIFGAVKEC